MSDKNSEWQSITTAPKDRRVLLYWPETEHEAARMACGEWCGDKYAKKPRPYWTWDGGIMRTTNSRHRQPMHWMPLPEIPNGVKP